MTKILGMQDSVRVIAWNDNHVVLILKVEGSDGYDFRLDLTHRGVCELMGALEQAMDDNDSGPEYTDEEAAIIDGIEDSLCDDGAS